MPNTRSIGIVIALGLLAGLTTVWLPPFRDHGIFLLTGDLIRDGHLPYRDAVDFKPPGIHLLYALGGLLSGSELWGPRLLDLLVHLAGVLALIRVAGPTPGAALAAGGLWTLLYFGAFGYAELGQPEGFLVSAVLLARAAATSGHARRWGLAGALFGVAILFKYTALLFLPLFAFETLSRRRVAAFAAGLGVCLLATTAYLVLGGAWSAFVTIQTEYVPGYSALVREDGARAALVGSAAIAWRFVTERPLLFLLAIGGVAGLLRTPRRPLLAPAVGLLAALVGVAVQGKLFFYHWIPAVPFLAWLGAAGWAAMAAGTSGGRRRAVRIAGALGAAAALAGTVLPRVDERRAALAFMAGTLDRDAYYGRPVFGSFGAGEAGTLAAWRLAESIAAHTPPEGRVFVWGFEPFAYVASGREPATRFIYNAPFVSPWCPDAWKQELLSALQTDPPHVVVLATHDAIPWVTGVPEDSRQALARYPALLSLFRARYEPVEEVERFIVLSRTP